jgi:hypothetical protein
MLKALDELERAVDRLVKKTESKGPAPSLPGRSGTVTADGVAGRGTSQDEPYNEEAADLIRRALKRLRSL